MLLLLIGLVATSAPSCSRGGVMRAGPLPPPDGEQLARAFFRSLAAEREAVGLPPVHRDQVLDAQATKGLGVIQAGIPDEVPVIEHVERVAPLPEGLSYGIGFESRTPGLDERTRALAERRAGSAIAEDLLAADPALDGVGWASSGPWSVVVLRGRLLGPADAPALRAALLGELRRERPNLRIDPQVEAAAAEAVVDGVLDADDLTRYGHAGGVPVRMTHEAAGPQLPTPPLNWTLQDEGPGTLRDPWLNQVGVAVKIDESGKVTYVVLATGEADKSALNAQLDTAAVNATDAVNKSRAEAALPTLRLDPGLMAVAKAWTVEAGHRGCFVGAETDHFACAGSNPRGADSWYVDVETWWSPEHPFVWYLAPPTPGQYDMKRFGAAATVGPDGVLWTALLLAA